MRVLLAAATVVGACALGSSAASAQSFRATCSQVSQRGPYIEATCANTAGFPVRSSIDASSCGGADIANANGRLVCAGYRGGGPRPGYGYGRPRRDYDDDDEDYRPRRRFGF